MFILQLREPLLSLDGHRGYFLLWLVHGALLEGKAALKHTGALYTHFYAILSNVQHLLPSPIVADQLGHRLKGEQV